MYSFAFPDMYVHGQNESSCVPVLPSLKTSYSWYKVFGVMNACDECEKYKDSRRIATDGSFMMSLVSSATSNSNSSFVFFIFPLNLFEANKTPRLSITLDFRT